jgi:hypothetical protein
MDFTATRWDTAEDKEAAAAAILRFVRSGFRRSLFTKRVYNALHVHLFGHIAEYDQDGFYDRWFARTRGRVNWLRYVADGGAYGINGDPSHTWSDVERYLRDELAKGGYLDEQLAVAASETEARDRAELARLKSIYEPTNS